MGAIDSNFEVGLMRTDRGLFLDKGNQVFDVRHPDFAGGAKGDGVADDRVAIQGAVDAASAAGGGIVLLPEGTFRIGAALTPKSGVRIEGAGAGLTVIDGDAGAYHAFNNTTAITDVYFGHFQVKNVGVSGGQEHTAFRVEGASRRVTFDHVIADDCDDAGFLIRGDGTDNPSGITFINCIARNQTEGAGFEFRDCSDVVAFRCSAIDNATHGFRASGGVTNLRLIDPYSEGNTNTNYWLGGKDDAGDGTIDAGGEVTDFALVRPFSRSPGTSGIQILKGVRDGEILSPNIDHSGSAGATNGILFQETETTTGTRNYMQDIAVRGGLVKNCSNSVRLLGGQMRNLRFEHMEIHPENSTGAGTEIAFFTNDSTTNAQEYIFIEHNRIITRTETGRLAFHHTDGNASTSHYRRWNTTMMTSPGADVRSGSAGSLTTQFNATETNEAL